MLCSTAGPANQLGRPRRGEGGFSFVEIVVAVAILGITIVALVTALLDTVGASTVHQQGAVSDTVLRNYVEAIKAAVQQNCSAMPPNGSYAAAPALTSFIPPTDATGYPYRTTVSVVSGPAFGTCPSAAVVSQLTVTVTPPQDQPQPAKPPALTVGVIDP